VGEKVGRAVVGDPVVGEKVGDAVVGEKVGRAVVGDPVVGEKVGRAVVGAAVGLGEEVGAADDLFDFFEDSAVGEGETVGAVYRVIAVIRQGKSGQPQHAHPLDMWRKERGDDNQKE
jgi:hypothetical protein